MLQPTSPTTMPEWQALALRDPGACAREIVRRCQTWLSPTQAAAVFATTTAEAHLVAGIERVANTVAPFAGAPYVLKDLFAVPSAPARAGSRFPDGILPSTTKESRIAHALKGLGAILAGKTHLHEFAYGLTGENPHYGDCEHPLLPGRTSGGSSSGSAAAVAAGIVPFGIGTDTGGSIRVPAAFCGLFGFREVPQSAWIHDAFPLAPSFDTAGWLARTATDLLSINRFLLGKSQQRTRVLRGVVLGFEVFGERVDETFDQAVRVVADCFAPPADATTISQFQRALSGSVQAYAVLQSSEAYAVHASWLDSYRAHYDPAVWARIDRGRHWTSAERNVAVAKRAEVTALWAEFFQSYDFAVLPSTPFPALRKEECTLENRNRLLALMVPASLAGLPVLSVPVPLSDKLTTGLQIVVNSPTSPVIPWVLQKCGG